MTNPFETIETKLDGIAVLLNNLRIQQKGSELQPKPDFKYVPIQDIFNKKICSKPTFYEHLKAGEFSLYKFGNKSFVDIEEFTRAFKKVKISIPNIPA